MRYWVYCWIVHTFSDRLIQVKLCFLRIFVSLDRYARIPETHNESIVDRISDVNYLGELAYYGFVLYLSVLNQVLLIFKHAYG